MPAPNPIIFGAVPPQQQAPYGPKAKITAKCKEEVKVPKAWHTPEVLERAKKAGIIPIDDIDFVERDAFLQGLAGEYTIAPLEPHQYILSKRYGTVPKISAPVWNNDLVPLAQLYASLVEREARVPAFGRWCSSLHPNNKKLVEALGVIGQQITGEQYVFSCDPIDILRCGSTPHFTSCFSPTGHMNHIPGKVCSEAPGIAIIYVDDAQGKMMRRLWAIHVRLAASEQDAIALIGRYGMPNLKGVGQAITKAKGIPVIEVSYGAPVEATILSGMKENMYFDCAVYGDLTGRLIK